MSGCSRQRAPMRKPEWSPAMLCEASGRLNVWVDCNSNDPCSMAAAAQFECLTTCQQLALTTLLEFAEVKTAFA